MPVKGHLGEKFSPVHIITTQTSRGPKGALTRSRATMKLKPTITTTKDSYSLRTFTDGRRPDI